MKKTLLLLAVLAAVASGCGKKISETKFGEINSGRLTEKEAQNIAEKTCIKGGEALSSGGIYNPNSKTWWFDANLNATREGCNPACVVSEETKTAEINWRCTGLKNPDQTIEKNSFTLGNDQMDQAVREYLQTQADFSWKTEDGGKNICVFEKLDGNELFPHYLWVRCGEFALKNGKVEELSGSSLPAMIDYPNELSFFDQTKFSHKIPKDGSLYAEDIKKIFPVELQDMVLRYDASRINEKIKEVAERDLN